MWIAWNTPMNLMDEMKMKKSFQAPFWCSNWFRFWDFVPSLVFRIVNIVSSSIAKLILEIASLSRWKRFNVVLVLHLEFQLKLLQYSRKDRLGYMKNNRRRDSFRLNFLGKIFNSHRASSTSSLLRIIRQRWCNHLWFFTSDYNSIFSYFKF